MPTIQDVAVRAGVSKSTVSHVINRTRSVDPETERRVRAAIEALGYRPNLLARSLRRRATQTIGLLIPDNANPFFADVARAIEDAGFAEGYNVILCNSDLSQVKQATYLNVLLAKRVDGLILVSSGLIPSEDRLDPLHRIRAAEVPTVVVDLDLGDAPVDQVLVDNELGGRLAAEYLTRLGHRQLACLTGPGEMSASVGRVEGFRRALDEAGASLPQEAVVRGNGRYDGGADGVRQLIRAGVPFTAVFAFNDLMAIGAIGAICRAGRRVPEDVSVIGFDDVPPAAAIFPSLTTVAQPVAEMGRLSVAMLLARIAGHDAPPARVVLPTTLVERESCRPLTNGAARPAGNLARGRAAWAEP